MKTNWISKYAMIWMIGSLALLFGFLAFWNIENYTNEQEDLAQLIQYNAELAAGEVRDSVFQVFVQRISSSDSIGDNQLSIFLDNTRSNVVNRKDSMHVAILNDASAMIQSHDGQDTTIYFSSSTRQDGKGIVQSLSNNISMSSSISYSSTDQDTITHNVVDFGDFNLNINYQNKTRNILIKRLEESGLPPALATISTNSKAENVTDTISREQRTYLIKKIIPSLLASLLLFIAICGTYIVIYGSWKQQERINEFKTEFVSNMTHELKTPIATVGVALEALSSFGAAQDPQKTKEYIDISKHEVNRLNILVDKVLKMSMYDKGVIKMNREAINTYDIVKSILASMKLHFEKHNVDIDFNSFGDNFNIEGDSVHITNVIYNLIDNAIKYSKDNPAVNITLRDSSDKISISVNDNGVGIPKEDLNKIFSQFYRVPSDNIHNVKGHGLGLNYVKSIIEEHGGKISVDSELGKGSTFSIILPKLMV